MKVFIVNKSQICILFLCLIIFGGIYYTYVRESNAVMTMMPTDRKTVIIDAGHGGWDPGKTGTLGENEKDINLKIALKLQAYLEQSGATVLITRIDDNSLAEKKRADLKERKALANDSDGDILISIHQNSFPSAKVKGAQVFYHNESEEGKRLAGKIQENMIGFADPENNRVIKPNTSYYILKNTTIPAAIVECGFLSNSGEEQKLNTDEYQEKVAWAIYMGIIDYFKEDGLK